MKGHLKKVIVTVAATLLLCALCLGMFTGCSSGNTISVYIFCATSDANTNQTLIDRWAEEYYAEHEEELSAQGIDEISVDFTYNGDSDDYYDQLANRVAAGSAADIIYVSPRNIKSYASNGIVLDLTDYVDWSKYGNGSDIWEGALASFTYSEETNTVGQDVTISGSNETGYTATATDTGEGVGIYAAPKDYSSFGLAYNKNFFTDTLKDAYTSTNGQSYTPPQDSVFYWNGSDWTPSDSYIKIGVTMKYYTYNFYRYDSYPEALNDGDPIAELSARNGGYEVTIPGWPGDTYEYTTATEEGAGYDTSLGYVTYTYAEYSAMTYAICWFAQIADRAYNGTHTLMTWLNSNDYTTHTPDSYDNEDRNIPQKQNYVYGNDQYEGSLYLAAWLLGNDTNFIDDTYTSVDARETWAEADNWRESNWEDSGNYDSDGDGLIDTFVTEDYGINSENFVEAYAAFRFFAVEIVALVGEYRRVAEYGKAVGKSARNHELTVVFRRKLHGHVLPVGGGGTAQIDGHVEHNAFEHAHELGLGVFALLKMQSSYRAVAGLRLIVLNKIIVKPGGFKGGFAVAFEKVAAFIRKNARLYDEYALNGRFNKVHAFPPALS